MNGHASLTTGFAPVARKEFSNGNPLRMAGIFITFLITTN